MTGGLKAAREEKLEGERARELLGLEVAGPGGGLVPRAGPTEDKMEPAPSAPHAAIAPGTKTEEVASNCSGVEATLPPPPYPPRGLYPSLKSFRDEGGGRSLEECSRSLEECSTISCRADKQVVGEDAAPGGGIAQPARCDNGCGTSLLPGSACCCSNFPNGTDCTVPLSSGFGSGAPSPMVQGPTPEGCGPTAPAPWVQPTLTDWARVREDLRAVDLSGIALTLPVVVKTEGPAWVPLDSKAITRLSEIVKTKGLRSPVTMAAVEALMASSLLPYDEVWLIGKPGRSKPTMPPSETEQEKRKDDFNKTPLLSSRDIFLCVLGVLFAPRLPTAQAWKSNGYINVTQAMAQRLNLSDCWVCAALPRGGMMEFPLLRVPMPFRNWSWPWNTVQIQRMGRGESLYWSVQDSCDPGRHTSRLPSGEILCWSFQDPLPSRPPKVVKPDIACHLNTSSLRFETLSPWPNDTIISARNGSHSVGHFSVMNVTWCPGSKHCPRPVVMALNNIGGTSLGCPPKGLWWLCGDGRARKSVPSDWSGSCTLGALIPNVVWHN